MEFEVLKPLIGGGLIGVSASALMLGSGRIAGVSGILGGILRPKSGEVLWRLLFVVGLLAGGLVMGLYFPDRFAAKLSSSPAVLIAAGLFVGLGVNIGSGCTSGHGICGLSRLSPRSAVSVPVFMVTAGIVVYLCKHLGGA